MPHEHRDLSVLLRELPDGFSFCKSQGRKNRHYVCFYNVWTVSLIFCFVKILQKGKGAEVPAKGKGAEVPAKGKGAEVPAKGKGAEVPAKGKGAAPQPFCRNAMFYTVQVSPALLRL